MKETQKIQKSTGSGSIQPSVNIEETFTRMEVNEDNMEQSSPYPDRPGERDCQFFLRTGQCSYGNSCRYNHPRTHFPQGVNYYNDELPERIGQPDCEYFLKTGACKYGSTCKYHHPKDRNGAGPMLFNVLGFPMRQGEKACPYYMQKGTCRFGVACKFNHPQPQPQLPNGHSTFGSSSYPYGGGFTMMPLPPATYGAMPPQSQGYMPFMVAPSQGLLPPQGWATYMAASNSMYQPGSSSSASVPVTVTSHHHNFSERAECRFFMNNGTCKFGDDCKYSHPKERLLQSPPNLPVRPGQPSCGNFKANGFCKFGANCKFDHSMPLNFVHNTGLTMSPLPNPNVPNHLRTSPSPSRSDLTSLSNGKPAAENQSSETEKQDDNSAKADISPPSQSDSTALPNGKPAAEDQSSKTEKQDEPSKSEMKDISPPSQSDSTVLPNGKPDAENQTSETEKQDDFPAKLDKSEMQDSS